MTLLAGGVAAPLDPRAPWPLAVPPVVLVAHGSRDPRSARTMHALAARVSARWPGGARAAFLDLNGPPVPDALREAVGGRGLPAIVVPALLTRAYHARVDVPEVLAASGVATRVTPVLGPAAPGEPPDPLLVAALVRRLSELDTGYDGVVLAAAGTSSGSARSTVDAVAAELASTVNSSCRVGYAAVSGPPVAEAVAQLRSEGSTRIAVAAYFLAPGRLYDGVAASAAAAGAVAVTRPLGAADEVVGLVLQRVLVATTTS